MNCVIELFLLERRFNSKKNSNYSSSEIDKWLNNYVTNFNCRWQQCCAFESTTVKIQKTISLIREWIRKLQRLLISIMTSYSSLSFRLLCHATQTFKNNKSHVLDLTCFPANSFQILHLSGSQFCLWSLFLAIFLSSLLVSFFSTR